MTKILVTGGAGFIGAHLAKNLRKNNKIMIVDNFENKGGIPYVNKSDIFVKGKSQLIWRYTLGVKVQNIKIDFTGSDVQLFVGFNDNNI